MGIRSDVGIALKSELCKKAMLLPIELLRDSDLCLRHQEGSLFVWEDIKWYIDNKEIATLYKLLKDSPLDQYLVVEACHDYPEAGNNRGLWTDNPWNLCKTLTVALQYEKVGIDEE